MTRILKKYKVLLLICAISILANVATKVHLIDRQVERLAFLQKITSATRSSSLVASKASQKTQNTEQQLIRRVLDTASEEFFVTQYAVKLHDLIDKNRLNLKHSLVFGVQEDSRLSLLKYTTHVNVTGRYPDIKHLIADFQNTKGLSHIDSLSMSRDSLNPARVSLKLGISVYFKRGNI